jgi:hypothetical protein
VSLFHADQGPLRERCEAILAAVTVDLEDPARDAAWKELIHVLEACRLPPGTTVRGVAGLLLTVQRTRNPATLRRSLERAIPARGLVRRERAAAAAIIVVALSIGFASISPWLLVAAIVLGVAIVACRVTIALRRYVRDGQGALHVARMEAAALAAEKAEDVETINALYAEARAMIAEDRVPARVGFRLAEVLRVAAKATPFPVELLRELRQLHFLAPEAELGYEAVRKSIEGCLQLRTFMLASRIGRGLDTREDVAPLRAELRELARTAPGATGARTQQVRLLRRLAKELPEPAALLDELEELLVRLESIEDRRARALDGVPRDLVAALDAVVARNGLDRARALAVRAKALV